tara:strand:- start:268 stop:522 length:255 start_codon:yes stop_codon:yes gene_type:complete
MPLEDFFIHQNIVTDLFAFPAEAAVYLMEIVLMKHLLMTAPIKVVLFKEITQHAPQYNVRSQMAPAASQQQEIVLIPPNQYVVP